MDVSSGEEIRQACEEILGEYECVDVLVNNAGITRDNLLFRMEEEDWNDVLHTNLTSCFHWIKSLGPTHDQKKMGAYSKYLFCGRLNRKRRASELLRCQGRYDRS